MARKAKTEPADDAIVDMYSLDKVEDVQDDLQSVDDLETNKPPDPSMFSPEWAEFVMGQFSEGEMDPSGNPRVHGLRRVVNKLLGPIISGEAKLVVPPQFVPGLENLNVLQPTVCSYTLSLLMKNQLSEGDDPYLITLTDVADVYSGNTDFDYARYPSGMASTRAEARCLRKALQIKSVSSEETTALPSSESGQDGKITPTQINFINVLCARNNINVMKFVNSGKNNYKSVDEIEFGTATKMIQALDAKQREGKVPAEISGYDKTWKD